MNELPLVHKVLGYAGSLVLLVTVVELVRRRQLSIRFSVFWVLSALGTLALTAFYSKIMNIVNAYGVQPISLSFFLAIIFLTLVCVYMAVRISTFERMLKDISQEIAILGTAVKGGDPQDKVDIRGPRKT